MPSAQTAVTSRWQRFAVYGAIVATYLAACRIMLAPICNFSHLATATYEGDARAFLWVLAWDNHVVLDRVPSLFNANKLYPLPNALVYGEHLFGISLFTLPVYALTRNPVLAYNVVWILCYVLLAAATHFIAWRYTRDHLAATVAGLTSAFCFYRMHHGHGHLSLLWCFWIPLSFVAIERWFARPAWTRLAVWVSIAVLQAIAGWYQAILITVADLLFVLWLVVVEHRRIPIAVFAAQTIAGGAVAFALVWPLAYPYFVLHTASPAFTAGTAADLTGWLVPPENTFAGQWLLARGIEGPRAV